MRRILSFQCEGATLAATLDDAPGATGLLIVSGGNEIRVGAHRGMAQLAAEIAQAGHPVFRFDRRGIGDSQGKNGEFSSSAPDLGAAILAFRHACPHLDRIIAFGNCDAATAILLHQPEGLAAAVLANVWVIERTDDMPPTAAIKARYVERVKDPSAWVGLFTGAINLKKLAEGLLRLAKPAAPTSLPHQVADGIMAFQGALSILVATRDATAIAFMDVWQKPIFAQARARTDVTICQIDSGSHSFASKADHRILMETLLTALKQA
jgi:exosortase A-associated hydrolase 1